VLDSFTKWAEAIPIRQHTAQVVARKLVEVVFARYGTPLRLLSDRGTEFESSLMSELYRAYQIEKIRTSSYKPSTNGALERFHKTLNSMVGKVVSESQKDWDRRLPEVMAAYRATVHQSTGFSPNFLVYGHENRAPLDLVLAVADEPEGIGASPDDYVNEMLERKRKAYDLVRRNLGRAAERRKREYDQKVRPKTFQQGAWVWYFYPRRYRGKSPKWQRHYVGPYLIIRELPPCNFVIQKSAKSKPIVAHVDKLKEYYGEPPTSWVAKEPDHPVAMGSPAEGSVPPAEPDRNELVEPMENEESQGVGVTVGNSDAREGSNEGNRAAESSISDSPEIVSPTGRRLRRPEQRRRPVRFL
jgi:hypothetical protein